MAKPSRSSFVCQNCGASSPRWSGRCDACGEWNTLVEENASTGIGAAPQARTMRKGTPVALVSLSGDLEEAPRVASGIAELDRVTGGGFVRGSALLVGGDPGIGKSTLLMQASAALARAGHPVVYVSGEEAVAQIRLRARRLGAVEANVGLAAETSVENIIATLEMGPPPALLIIDSIQTLWTELADSAPGTVTQVRAAAQAMIRYAKKSGTTVVLVGHVTKDGQIAGPRVVEHMVDAVLYFEGEGAHHFRILRTVKNRFGPTDEIGVFEMSDKGLREVPNPSELFLSERNASAPGAAVFAGMEGTRPVLVEIQALVAPTSLGTPRRAVVGWDGPRLAMVLAVLEARCGVRFGQHDVYLNVAGGYRISEPAADLAVAAALVSSLAGKPLPADSVWFGEASLSGAVRPVAHSPARLKEAEKLGFALANAPKGVEA
ncbi:MAG TPA: DNA repair protein RadA, partial [Rhizobiaceae bacterium]|nr:DNA repair protein RadA [Rhizobiaceae bacterium]